jgi:lipopolysaccharide export system permease protein
VLALENPKELFIASELSFDLLYNRLQSSKLISTAELIHRLKSPAFGQSTERLSQHLHARIVRPLANILAALLAIPLILRKESRGLITNMALSAATLVTMLAFSEAVAYGGRTGSISPELAAWIPIISTGTLFAWLSGIMQT